MRILEYNGIGSKLKNGNRRYTIGPKNDFYKTIHEKALELCSRESELPRRIVGISFRFTGKDVFVCLEVENG